MEKLGRGFAWLDTGTHDALSRRRVRADARKRQGLQDRLPEEVAYGAGFISTAQLSEIAQSLGNSSYGEYLRSLCRPQ